MGWLWTREITLRGMTCWVGADRRLSPVSSAVGAVGTAGWWQLFPVSHMDKVCQMKCNQWKWHSFCRLSNNIAVLELDRRFNLHCRMKGPFFWPNICPDKMMWNMMTYLNWCCLVHFLSQPTCLLWCLLPKSSYYVIKSCVPGWCREAPGKHNCVVPPRPRAWVIQEKLLLMLQ